MDERMLRLALMEANLERYKKAREFPRFSSDISQCQQYR